MKTRPRFSTLHLRVLRTIRRFGMLRRGDHVLVAASGGADSTALLLCLDDLAAVLGLELTVAHLNHGIRGADAAADEEFVRRLSTELGRPFVCESADLPARAAAAGKNLEEAAREARYAFLRRAAAEAGAARIATGHTLNDQAETVLQRLLRGSGPGGLAGIHPVAGGRVIRPLIECSRSQILDFLEKRGSGWREDASNLDLRYQRNRIRRELLPYLEKHFNPRLVETLGREAGIAAAAADFLEEHARREFERLRAPAPGGIAMPAAGLAGLHAALRPEIIRLALVELSGSRRGVEAVHIEEVLRLCGPGRSGRLVELPGGIRARRDLDLLVLASDSGRPGGFHYELTWPGRCWVPEAGLEFSASLEEPHADAQMPCNQDYIRVRLDPEMLPATLIVRSPLPGDRYGGAGHRKLTKMLLAARIPRPRRERLPVVAAGSAVIWVPGFPPARFYRAKPHAGRSVILEAVAKTGV